MACCQLDRIEQDPAEMKRDAQIAKTLKSAKAELERTVKLLLLGMAFVDTLHHTMQVIFSRNLLTCRV
jgi:hypothetical protein